MSGVDGDDLYGLPLDRFVTERTVLSRALRAEGKRDAAAAVAARPKPTVAAWAVNQLVRTQKREITSLLHAGDALRQAQDDVVAGHGDGHALRAAAETERSAVGGLVRTASGLLGSDGHPLSPAILEHVAETLHAAALDDDARAEVRPGCLQRELRHVGFGVGAAFGPTPGPRPKAPASRQKAPASRPNAQRRPAASSRADAEAAPELALKQAERAQAERARAQARRAARAAASQARRRAERANRALALAQERRDQAEQALTEADQTLAAARAEAQAAEAEAEARAEADRDA